MSVPILPFPKDGVRLSEFDIFIEKCGGDKMLEGLSTTDVNKTFQMPFTKDDNCSYCDQLKLHNSSNVGPATVFILHAWKFEFLHVIDALRWHFKETPHIIVWFDMFSNNQHGAPDLYFNWWSTTFKSAISQFGHTVLILSPWNDPIPLTRAWCLFEIYCTVETGSKFEIAMSSHEQLCFLDSMENDYESLQCMLATVDARKSEAWNPSDKEKIFDVVEKTVGFDAVNSAVFEVMRNWLVDTVKAHMSEAGGDSNHMLSLTLARLYNRFGLKSNAEVIALCESYLEFLNAKASIEVSKDTSNSHNDAVAVMSVIGACRRGEGHHVEAERLHRECVEICTTKYGRKHIRTLDALKQLSSTLEAQWKYDEALELAMGCLEVLTETLGTNHPDTLFAMNDIGSMLMQNGQYDDAKDYYQKCLDIRRSVLGEDHPETLVTTSNLAVLLRSQGQYSAAEELLLRGYNTCRIKLGARSVNTLTFMNNLGVVYESQGRYDDAEDMHMRCLTLRRELLGNDHPDTLVSMNRLGIVYELLKRFIEAEALYAECLDRRTVLLGKEHPSTLTSLTSLAGVCASLGQFERSLAVYEEALPLNKKVLGASHPSTLLVMNNFARLLEESGRADEAEKMHLEVLDLKTSALGRDHPSTLISLSNMGALYEVQANYSKAQLYYGECFQLRAKKLGEKHPSTLRSQASFDRVTAALSSAT